MYCYKSLITMDSIKLGYWKVRGRAQVSRLLLAYTEANWTDVQYTMEQKEKWFEKDKKELGIPFPNLPYIIDGDIKISESSAVEHYIIMRSNFKDLLGTDVKEKVIMKNIIGILGDIRAAVVGRTIFGESK